MESETDSGAARAARSGGGAADRGFPATRLSVVRALASRDDAVRRPAFAALADGYWKPSYKYLRMRWRLGAEDAEDLTQSFFAQVLEKRYFDRYDPARARFRTYLRTCLDRFASNRRRAERRLKRGGGEAVVSLDSAPGWTPDFAAAERELGRTAPADRLADASPEADPEGWFHREWRRALFQRAVMRLRERAAGGREARFTVFERYDLAGGREAGLTYAALGEELGLPATQVTNHLAWARRELRRVVLELLEELCGSDEEVAAEARDLLEGGA
jgi:RNA polymerase sigma factor (sigma-70 family)